MSKLKKDFLYNIMYQILQLILPLITIPYISRVLGAEGVGTYSYTYSIVYYFMLIALLGINNYGNRSIAQNRENRDKMSKKFLSIYAIQLIMSITMIIVYMLYILLVCNEYKNIALIQSIFLISSMLDINWFFFGMEEFKLTITRNTILKFISLIFVFIFVKNPSDLWIYTLIMAGSTLISQVVLWPFLLKRISYVKITLKDIKKHIKPCIILFIPVIAISLYRVMDKIMLGIMSDVTEVGYYEQAEKIITVPTGVVTALGTVMLPKISNLVANEKYDEMKLYIEKSIKFMMFMAFPVSFGIVAISGDFVPLFLGNEFEKSIMLVDILATTTLFMAFANVLRTQYLLPKEKDNIYIYSVIGGAIINLIINIILIPKLQSIGATIGTIIAEAFVMIYQTISVKKELPIKEYIISTFPFFIKAIIMFAIVMSIKLLKLNGIITIVIQVIVGCIIYFITNIKYINSVVDIKEMLLNFKKIQIESNNKE